MGIGGYRCGVGVLCLCVSVSNHQAALEKSRRFFSCGNTSYAPQAWSRVRFVIHHGRGLLTGSKLTAQRKFQLAMMVWNSTFCCTCFFMVIAILFLGL